MRITTRLAGWALGGAMSLLAGGALAQSDSRLFSDMNTPAGMFYLTDQDDVEVVRYTSPRNLFVCLPRSAPNGPATTVPLNVKWDAYSATIRPGNCLFFDAKTVRVSPAAPLPQGIVLQGAVGSS